MFGKLLQLEAIFRTYLKCTKSAWLPSGGAYSAPQNHV